MVFRNGLKESLEQYAARFKPPLSPDQVRATWRAQGLNFLARERQPLEYWIPYVTQSAVRVCPGASIYTTPLLEGEDWNYKSHHRIQIID